MLTLCDWQLAIAALAYEHGQPSMSDDTYDRLAQLAGQRGTELPGFSDITGQWVHRMDVQELYKIWQTALSYNEGKDDLHAPAIIDALREHGVEFGCCQAGGQCW